MQHKVRKLYKVQINEQSKISYHKNIPYEKGKLTLKEKAYEEERQPHLSPPPPNKLTSTLGLVNPDGSTSLIFQLKQLKVHISFKAGRVQVPSALLQ